MGALVYSFEFCGRVLCYLLFSNGVSVSDYSLIFKGLFLHQHLRVLRCRVQGPALEVSRNSSPVPCPALPCPAPALCPALCPLPLPSLCPLPCLPCLPCLPSARPCPASRAGLRTSSSPDRARRPGCLLETLAFRRAACATRNRTPIHISSAWLCNVVVYVSNGERKQRARKPPLRGVWGVNPKP